VSGAICISASSAHQLGPQGSQHLWLKGAKRTIQGFLCSGDHIGRKDSIWSFPKWNKTEIGAIKKPPVKEIAFFGLILIQILLSAVSSIFLKNSILSIARVGQKPGWVNISDKP